MVIKGQGGVVMEMFFTLNVTVDTQTYTCNKVG